MRPVVLSHLMSRRDQFATIPFRLYVLGCTERFSIMLRLGHLHAAESRTNSLQTSALFLF